MAGKLARVWPVRAVLVMTGGLLLSTPNLNGKSDLKLCGAGRRGKKKAGFLSPII